MQCEVLRYKIELMVPGGWGSVNLTICQHTAHQNLTALRRERCLFNNHGVILTLITHWLWPRTLCFTVVLQSHASNLEREALTRKTPGRQ